MCAALFLAQGLIMKTTVPCSSEKREPKPIEVKRSLSVERSLDQATCLLCKREDSPHKTHAVKEKGHMEVRLGG